MTKDNKVEFDRSWCLFNGEIAYKKIDKSALNHNESGIPPKIRDFFEIDKLNNKEKREIFLHDKIKKYESDLVRKVTDSDRGYISWKKGMKLAIKNAKLEIDDYIRFEKRDTYNYDVQFGKVIEGFETIEEGLEGIKIEYYGSRYERDPYLRKQAISIYGTKCQICGFDFEKIYGELGKGFIEVHHKTPLSRGGGIEKKTDVTDDLICVCSNCHRMLHKFGNDVIPVDTLKEIIRKRKDKSE